MTLQISLPGKHIIIGPHHYKLLNKNYSSRHQSRNAKKDTANRQHDLNQVIFFAKSICDLLPPVIHRSKPGRICFSFATFPFSFGKRAPREVQTPRKTTDSKSTLPRELQRLVVDSINHRTDHDAMIRPNAVENRL